MPDPQPTAADMACVEAICRSLFGPSWQLEADDRMLAALIARHTAEQTALLRADCKDCHERLNAYKAKLAEAQQELEATGATGDSVASGIRRLAFLREQAERKATGLLAVNAELLAACHLSRKAIIELADQQAMSDDWYKRPLEAIRAAIALAEAGREGTPT